MAEVLSSQRGFLGKRNIMNIKLESIATVTSSGRNPWRMYLPDRPFHNFRGEFYEVAECRTTDYKARKLG